MKLPRSLIIGILGIIVIVVFVVYNAYCNWCTVGADFYRVRLIEVIQLFATGLIAIYIAYMVGSNIQNDQKRKEVLIDLIKKYNDDLNELMDISYDYISSPAREKEGKIKISFKHANMLLGVAIKSKFLVPRNKEASDCLCSIVNLFLKLKRYVTDTPFGQNTPKYDDLQITYIQTTYNSILGKIYEYRMHIYK